LQNEVTTISISHLEAIIFAGWNNATGPKTSLETVLGVPRTLNFADLGYFKVALFRPSGLKKSKKQF
jgi:hypothetical protein